MKNLIMLLAVTFSFAMVNAQSSTIEKSVNAQEVTTKSACKPGCEKTCCTKSATKPACKASCTKDAKKTCTKSEKKACTKSATKACCASKTASTSKACCSKSASKSCSKTAGASKSCSGASAYSKLVSPQDFKSYMDRFPAEQVVDVRTKSEIKNSGMIDGARNIDFNASYFKEEIGKLDKNAAIMVYCKSGNRSGKAVTMLKEMGFKKIYDLDGGYNAYSTASLK